MTSTSGKELLARAIKREKSWSLFDKTSKYEDAADLYIKAANMFKHEKNLEEAAKCFLLAVKCYELTDGKYYAASYLLEAANCLKKINVSESINLMISAKELYSVEGKFQTAAKICKDVAELMEKDDKFCSINSDKEYLVSVLSKYQEAMDLFRTENVKSSLLACGKKIVSIYVMLGDFFQAADMSENISKEINENDSLLKFQSKELFFIAGLCYLATNDIIGTEKALQRFCEISPQFSVSREFDFLRDITKLVEEKDENKLGLTIKEFDSITPLDPTKIKILLAIRKTIPSSSEIKLTEEDGLA